MTVDEQRLDRQKQIDRMVDGELNAAQQRELLLECEERDHWRDLALAYVESHAFTTELKGFADFPTERETIQPPHDHAGESDRRQSSWNAWSLAAAVLLSLSIGYGAGWSWKLPSITTFGKDRIVQGKDLSTSPDRAQSMQFMVANPLTNELQEIQLPLVNSSDLEPGWQNRLRPKRLPDDLLRQLNAGGLNVQQTRTLTPVRLRDGSRVIVPVDYYIERPFQ